MKFFKLKLHNQIFIALVLGTIFGSVFHVDKNELKLTYYENNIAHSVEIQNWSEFTFLYTDSKTFYENDQWKIIQKFKSLSDDDKRLLTLIIDGKEYSNIKSIEKIKTISSFFKPVGDIFIRLLNMIAIPLVLASLIVGVASLGNIKRLARIGTKTISLYLVTTAIAISIGLVLADVIQPGKQMSQQTKTELLNAYEGDVAQKISSELDLDLVQQLINIVPKNPFKAMADSEMLQIVFFAVLFGVALTFINKDKSTTIIAFFESVSDTMIKLVDIVMLIAPLAVFALISFVVGEFGFEIVQTLLWYALAVLLGFLIHMFLIYGGMIKIFTPVKLKSFFSALRPAQAVAFSTSSSAATLPVTMECCNENLGISKSITSFTLPLGATINMDGTALYQGVAAMFIAQVYGIDLNLSQQLTIVLTATLASIGTAPIPGVGIIMLLIVLKSVGIPEEGIALILGIDRILDMCRTIPNITGDAAVSTVIAYSEKEINLNKI